MLACVCQPADPGIFRRSPIPLGAPPLKINKGAIPKPGRSVRLTTPVITDPPGLKTKQDKEEMRTKYTKCKKDGVIKSDKDKCSENGDCDKDRRKKANEFEKVLFYVCV